MPYGMRTTQKLKLSYLESNLIRIELTVVQGCIQPASCNILAKIGQCMHFFHVIASTISNFINHFHMKYTY